MDNNYGSDFMTIVDEDGTEFELEVLSTLEYNGCTYLAVIPAGIEDDEEDLEVSILKNEEEDGDVTYKYITEYAKGDKAGSVMDKEAAEEK